MKSIIKKINNSKYISIVIVLVFALASIVFLMHSGLILGHDLEYHLSRIDSIAKCINIGDFKALIHEGLNNYGYANGLCYSNLFLYPAALLVTFGVPLIVSYKIYVILFSMITGLAMYYPVKKITKSNFAAMISSCVYLTCSYRICDVMVRGALGESLSFIFMPLIILGLYYIIYDDYKKFWVFSLGFVGLVNCHLISTIIMAIISLGFILLNYEKILDEPKRIKYLIYSGLLGLLLGAFFILPMLEFYIKNNILIKNTTDQTMLIMNFEQVLCGLPKFTTRFVAPGIGFIFIYFLYCRFSLKLGKKDNKTKFFDSCNTIGIMCLLAASSILPWNEISKFFGFIQFTWRLFVPICAFFAFAAGIYFEKYLENRKYKNTVVVTVLVYVLIASFVFQILSVKSLENYWGENRNIYINDLEQFTIASGEYMLVNTDWSLLDLDVRKIKTNNENLKVKFLDKGSISYIKFENNDLNDTYIDVPKIIYKGYIAKSKSNNRRYNITEGYNTWIRIHLGDMKSDEIKLYYGGTKVLNGSYIISILGWIGFISYFVYDKNLKGRKK